MLAVNSVILSDLPMQHISSDSCAVNCISLTAVRVNTGGCYVVRRTHGSSRISRSFWL